MRIIYPQAYSLDAPETHTHTDRDPHLVLLAVLVVAVLVVVLAVLVIILAVLVVVLAAVLLLVLQEDSTPRRR